jgi:hypothetical protein
MFRRVPAETLRGKKRDGVYPKILRYGSSYWHYKLLVIN